MRLYLDIPIFAMLPLKIGSINEYGKIIGTKIIKFLCVITMIVAWLLKFGTLACDRLHARMDN